MSVAELQKKLIEKISKTNDLNTLEEISNLIGLNEGASSIYYLSDEQLTAIDEAEQQIKEGKYFTNEEANKEIDKWLEE